MNICVDIMIDSPIGPVWDAITDFENCEKMVSGILSAKVLERPDDGLVGLKWTETRTMFGKECDETMWITDAKEHSFYETRAENHGAIYVSKMSVNEIDGQTKLTMSFSGTSDSMLVRIISSVMNLFMKNSMVKMLETDLSDIKQFVEQQASS